MTIDPITSLAFSLHAQPGVFAVLLGSGASRAADIPTGWGIVNDLVRQLADSEGVSLQGEPFAWYQERFGEPVGFSSLLSQLAPHVTDRQALLARYIEPLEGENHRRPTEAHRALAELASAGFVRVFLTTNFDQLLEQALTDAGVPPLVVSSPAAARGAPALQHAGVVVFKLHGDYRDPGSMLVTEDELQRYDSDVKRLLDRVLEDYGLITCGWSAEWDPALLEAVTATRARRYPLYCAVRGEPSSRLAEMIRVRQGVVLPIDDADHFFRMLADRVMSIERSNQPHPLDTMAMVGQLKRLIAARAHTVEINDLVMAETERVIDTLADETLFPLDGRLLAERENTWRFLVDQAHRYFGTIDGLTHLFVVGGAWSDPVDVGVWRRSLERIGNHGLSLVGGDQRLIKLRRLPLLTLLYAGSIAAVANNNFEFLRSITTDATVRQDGDKVPVIGVAHPWWALDDRMLVNVLAMVGEERPPEAVVERLQSQGGWLYTPHSDLLHRIVREPFRDLLPDDAEYDETFDRAEIFLALIAADAKRRSEERDGIYVPGAWYGRFTWRHRIESHPPEERLAQQATAAGSDWEPIRAGLFGSDPGRSGAAFAVVLEGAAAARLKRW